MRSIAMFGAVLLMACGAHHAAEAPTPTAALAPCDVAVPSVDSLGWKLVQATDFTFCVPPDWHPAGARGWRGGGTDIEWAAGAPFPKTEVAVRRVPIGPGTTTAGIELTPRHLFEAIGGESAELWDTRFRDVDYTAAQWPEKRVYFRGKARSPRTADIELTIYRTVRFNAADAGA